MNEKVMEALDYLTGAPLPARTKRAATIRAYIEGLEEDKANSARQDMAIWRYLQFVSPWSPSNDMEWCDEIITGIDFLRERAEAAESRVRELEDALQAATGDACAWEYWRDRARQAESARIVPEGEQR